MTISDDALRASGFREGDISALLPDLQSTKELAHEVAIEKFTLAELDEEEQNLDRLRRWYRELRTRDLFGAPSAARAEQRLKACVESLEQFAEQVYEARERP